MEPAHTVFSLETEMERILGPLVIQQADESVETNGTGFADENPGLHPRLGVEATYWAEWVH